MAVETKDAVIGVDIGGTTTNITFVSRSGEVFPISNRTNYSRGADIIGVIKDHLALMPHSALVTNNNLNVVGAGIAIPGPADYEKGVFTDGHKFPDLEGVNLRELLSVGFPYPIRFLNDADAFGLGVAWMEYPNESKLLAITLGTGLGSAFLVNGELATEGEGVPNGGEIWNLPYDTNRILEDVVSRKFIEQRFAAFTGEQLQVIDIAKLARIGHHEAKETFLTFGIYLGEALKIASRDFNPTRIVLGGGISGAFDLFGAMAQERFEGFFVTDPNVPIVKVQTPNLSLLGAAKHAFDKLS